MAWLNHRKYFHPPSNAFPTAILVRDYKKSDRNFSTRFDRQWTRAIIKSSWLLLFLDTRVILSNCREPEGGWNRTKSGEADVARLASPTGSRVTATITCLRFASSRGNSTISRHESGMRRVRVDIQAWKAGLLDPPDDLDHSSGARPRRPKPSDKNLRSQTKSRRSVACSSFSSVFRRTRATMDQGRNTTSWHDFKAAHPPSGTICHAPPWSILFSTCYPGRSGWRVELSVHEKVKLLERKETWRWEVWRGRNKIDKLLRF